MGRVEVISVWQRLHVPAAGLICVSKGVRHMCTASTQHAQSAHSQPTLHNAHSVACLVLVSSRSSITCRHTWVTRPRRGCGQVGTGVGAPHWGGKGAADSSSHRCSQSSKQTNCSAP